MLGIVILAHTAPAQLTALLDDLRHPRARIYLHIDRRSRMGSFDGTEMLPRHRTPWGSPGAVDAALEGLRAGLGDGCDYFTLISGQDRPVRPVDEIVSFFERDTRTFIHHWPLYESVHRFHGRNRTDFYTYTILGRRRLCIPKGEDTSHLTLKSKAVNSLLRLRARKPRSFPSYTQPFAGFAWWNMSRDAAEFVLDFLRRHPDYRPYHEHTSCPDEVFFHSILAGSGYPVVNESLRYYDWDGSRSKLLTEADLPVARASGALFARKF